MLAGEQPRNREASLSALSESMFTALGLGSLLILLRTNSVRINSGTAPILLASGALTVASYWVRYAGILWVVAWVVIVVVLLISTGGPKLSRLSVSLAGAAVASLMIPLVVPATSH